MRTEAEMKLSDLVWDISEIRGLDSVRLVHSILVEAALHCEKKFNIEILDEIRRSYPFKGMDMSERIFILRNIFYLISMNVHQGIDPPDSTLNIQQELPGNIESCLELTGLSTEEIYEIFSSAKQNVQKNTLWKIYEDNVYVKLESGTR